MGVEIITSVALSVYLRSLFECGITFILCRSIFLQAFRRIQYLKSIPWLSCKGLSHAQYSNNRSFNYDGRVVFFCVCSLVDIFKIQCCLGHCGGYCFAVALPNLNLEG
jgi:hypothetical protein